jgi:hypothetical protein
VDDRELVQAITAYVNEFAEGGNMEGAYTSTHALKQKIYELVQDGIEESDFPVED